MNTPEEIGIPIEPPDSLEEEIEPPRSQEKEIEQSKLATWPDSIVIQPNVGSAASLVPVISQISPPSFLTINKRDMILIF